MQKQIKIVIGIAIIAVFLVGGYMINGGFTDRTMKIGVITGLTGKYAPYGEMMQRGAQIAIKDLNQQAGYEKFGLMVQDSQSDNNGALSAYRNMKDSVAGFITGQSSVVLALAPLVNNDRVVLMNVTALSPEIRKAGDYVFSDVNDSTVEVSKMAEYMFEKGLRKVAIVYENTDGGKGAAAVFREKFKALGGSIVDEETYNGRATDVKTQLAKIKSADPRGIYMASYPEDAGMIVRQAKEIGLRTEWFAWNIESAEITKIGGDAANGLTYTTTTFDITDGGKTEAFAKEFKDAFGVDPNIYAATAYDGIMLLAQGIEKAPNAGEKVKSYLYGVKDYEGISGRTSFDSDGSVLKTVGFKQIEDGRFIDIK